MLYDTHALRLHRLAYRLSGFLQRVLIGGFAAGVVMNALDYVSNEDEFLMRSDFRRIGDDGQHQHIEPCGFSSSRLIWIFPREGNGKHIFTIAKQFYGNGGARLTDDLFPGRARKNANHRKRLRVDLRARFRFEDKLNPEAGASQRVGMFDSPVATFPYNRKIGGKLPALAFKVFIRDRRGGGRNSRGDVGFLRGFVSTSANRDSEETSKQLMGDWNTH